MKVLVTGGSGTLGGYVLRELLRFGHIPTCYSRSPSSIERVTSVPGDITDSESLFLASQGQEAIIHMAAVPGPGRATPQQMMAVNLIGTINVLEAARLQRISKVVFASSAAVLGFTFQQTPMEPHYFPVDEAHPCEPQDGYGLSKLLAENACRSYSAAYGIRTLCLRINNNWYLDREGAQLAVRGGWARGLTVEDLWKQRYRRTIYEAEAAWAVPGPPSPRNNLWTVTDARDAAQGFRLALEEKRILHDVFFINGNESCSLETTPELVARHYSGVVLRSPIQGHTTLISHQKATELLGYRPKYSWRRSDFWEWSTALGPEASKDQPYRKS